jgi:hypothetical protein
LTTENVVVLVTDMVGSTVLASSLPSRAGDLATLSVSSPRRWPTTGLDHEPRFVDADKVDVLEMALALLGDDPDRARLLATLCSELGFGSPLEPRQALADEASRSPNPSKENGVAVVGSRSRECGPEPVDEGAISDERWGVSGIKAPVDEAGERLGGQLEVRRTLASG